jgi:hypothetical protein
LMFEQIRVHGLMGFTTSHVPAKAGHNDHFYRIPLNLFINLYAYASQMIFSLWPKMLEFQPFQSDVNPF